VAHGFLLAPGRNGGTEDVADDEPFEEKVQRLVATLEPQFAESQRLEAVIRSNRVSLGYREEETT
jgi:type I restriction enzyme M protein